MKPPYSQIVTLDLNTGDYAWKVPLGTTPKSVSEHPALRGKIFPTPAGSACRRFSSSPRRC